MKKKPDRGLRGQDRQMAHTAKRHLKTLWIQASGKIQGDFFRSAPHAVHKDQATYHTSPASPISSNPIPCEIA